MKEIQAMTIDSADYPRRCLFCNDISPILYYKGNNQINDVRTIGIIGKRRCLEMGKNAAIDLATQKSQQGIAVISGFAKGIDSYAHTATIKEKGYTVAVMGCGLDICYPAEQIALLKAIEERGMTISPFPPGIKPRQYAFPVRNKIIAALSDELYVIESKENSGTQSTIAAAKRYGKKVERLGI